MEEKKERYCELLIVKADDGQRYVVKAPSNEAHKGYLVEFDTESGTRRGIVEDLMWCVVEKEVYRCIQHIAPSTKCGQSIIADGMRKRNLTGINDL